jgi:hypothetical protein
MAVPVSLPPSPGAQEEPQVARKYRMRERCRGGRSTRNTQLGRAEAVGDPRLRGEREYGNSHRAASHSDPDQSFDAPKHQARPGMPVGWEPSGSPIQPCFKVGIPPRPAGHGPNCEARRQVLSEPRGPQGTRGRDWWTRNPGRTRLATWRSDTAAICLHSHLLKSHSFNACVSVLTILRKFTILTHGGRVVPRARVDCRIRGIQPSLTVANLTKPDVTFSGSVFVHTLYSESSINSVLSGPDDENL